MRAFQIGCFLGALAASEALAEGNATPHTAGDVKMMRERAQRVDRMNREADERMWKRPLKKQFEKPIQDQGKP